MVQQSHQDTGKVNINKWLNAGVRYVKDLKHESGSILTLEQFNNQYGLHINFIQYYGVISAIPREWKIIRAMRPDTDSKPCMLDKICKAEKASKLAYCHFINLTAQFPFMLTDKWVEELTDDTISNDTILNSFRKLYAATIVAGKIILTQC